MTDIADLTQQLTRRLPEQVLHELSNGNMAQKHAEFGGRTVLDIATSTAEEVIRINFGDNGMAAWELVVGANPKLAESYVSALVLLGVLMIDEIVNPQKPHRLD